MMTTYRRSFEEKLVAIQQAVDDLPARVDEYIPGVSRPQIKRFFQRFSVLFGRIDKDGAKHPILLAYDKTNALDYILENADAIVDSLRAGPDNFFQNWLNTLVWLQLQIERAVGTSADELKSLSVAAAEDLRVAISRGEESLSRIRTLDDEAKTVQGDMRKAQAESRKSANLAAESLESINTLRTKLEKLASSDGRTKDSLEGLIKSVRIKSSFILEESEKISRSLQSADETRLEISEIYNQSKRLSEEINTVRDDAEKILNLSTQAGLAASYLRESTFLRRRANFFTGLLYGAAVITILVAIFYVIPSLEKALVGNKTAIDTVAIALLRTSILAPLVYIFYFTTKQINSIETLRMDYAEKAAVSLAYSGYKDEMSSDKSLLDHLRASLLLRFAEHPERLLRKRPTQEKLEVEAPGFKATAATADYPAKSADDDQ